MTVADQSKEFGPMVVDNRHWQGVDPPAPQSDSYTQQNYSSENWNYWKKNTGCRGGGGGEGIIHPVKWSRIIGQKCWIGRNNTLLLMGGGPIAIMWGECRRECSERQRRGNRNRQKKDIGWDGRCWRWWRGGRRSGGRTTMGRKRHIFGLKRKIIHAV